MKETRFVASERPMAESRAEARRRVEGGGYASPWSIVWFRLWAWWHRG